MEELNKLSKKELIVKLVSYMGNCKQQKSKLINKIYQIKNFRMRLKKIRDSVDYLISHPYSNDTGFSTKKHQRDVPHNQLIKQSIENKRGLE